MLLKTLKENGYFVWWGGKNDLVPGQYGYEDYCQVKYQPPAPPRVPRPAQPTPSGAARRKAIRIIPSTSAAWIASPMIMICITWTAIGPMCWEQSN